MSELADKIKERIKEYKFNYQTEKVGKEVESILETSLSANDKPEFYAKLYACLELETTANSQTISSLERQLESLNNLPESASDIAAVVCAPFYTQDFSDSLVETKTVTSAVIGSSLPSYIEVIVAEAGLAQMDGAKEFELIFPAHHYFNNHFEEIFDTISEIKNMTPECLLKTRIAISQFPSLNDLAKACTLALESGADGVSLYAETFDKSLENAIYVVADIIQKFDTKAATSTILKVTAETHEEALVVSTIATKLRGLSSINSKQFRIGISNIESIL